ncbi:MAG: type II secretion system major pseudopilin GspG [Methyloprofundus sp.]|nr:type II secretion system major pseudopilin GspG [Methyloprofundus sp.]
MRKKLTQGFTLIEIMVVVVILGILAAVVVPQVMDHPDTARLTKAKQDIRAIESALNLYKLDKFNYPTTEEGLEILQPKYLDRLPKDPWGNVYLYLSPGERSAIDIFTYGADGKKDGDGMNADLGNWDTD